MQQGHVFLDGIEITILDEADHMADLGFLPGVRRIMEKTPPKSQRLLFSATLDGAINVLVKRFLTNPVTHEADSAQSPVSTMSHHVLHVDNGSHLPVLLDLTAAPGRTVVFTRTKHRAKKLAKQLNASGVPAVELHGNLSQGARTRNMDDFHSGRAPDARRDRHRRPRHPRRRRRARHPRRPAGRAQGLPPPLGPHGPRRQRRHRRHDDARRAGARRARPDPQGRHQADHDARPARPPAPDRARPRRAVVCRWPRPRGRAPSGSGGAPAVAAPAVDAAAVAAAGGAVRRWPWRAGAGRRPARVVAVGAAATRARGRAAVPVAAQLVAVAVRAVGRLGRRRQRRRFRPSRRHLDRLLDEQRRQRRVVLRRHAAPAPAAPADPRPLPTFNRREATAARNLEAKPLAPELAPAHVASTFEVGEWPRRSGTWPFEGWGSGAFEGAAAAAELGDDLAVRLPASPSRR